MPESKNAQRDGAAPGMGRALVYGLVSLQLLQPFTQAVAAVVPASPGISQDTAANGVPIVNIAKPGASGISHNRYTRFDVGSEGLILNNSAQPSNTQLGGYITGNSNLGNGSARLILNEVTAANPSQLNGYMEVAGQRAEVVVANPYGIACNGCGFINTSKGTLTTGTPLWNSDGSLRGFNVENGVLRIDGNGLNGSHMDGLALYARVLELNASLYAKNLDVAVGSNVVDAVTGEVTAQAAPSPGPSYAIDSTALGGMYADTIRLVGTEAGVGMRLAGPVAALTGQLEVLNNGDVRLARTSANTYLTVQAEGSLTLTAQTSAGADVTLQAGDAVALEGAAQLTGADTSITASNIHAAAGSAIAARGRLTIDAAQQNYAGSLGAENMLRLTGSTIGNTGLVAAGTGFQLSAHDFSNSGTVDISAGDAVINLSGAFNNSNGSLQHGGSHLSLSAASLANSAGSISSAGSLALNLPTFDRAQSGGSYVAGGLLTLDVDGDITFSGEDFITAGGLLIETEANLHIDSRILAGADITLDAADIELSATGFVAAQERLSTDSINLTNLGVLYGRSALSLHVESNLDNGSATSAVAAALLSEGDIHISTRDDGQLQTVNNYGGQVESLSGNVTLRAQTLNNINVGWEIAAPYRLPSTFEYNISEESFRTFHYCCSRWGEDVDSIRIETSIERHDFASRGQAGEIVAGKNILLDLDTLFNDHSLISAHGTLDIYANTISNVGTTLTDRIVKTSIVRWHTCWYDDLGDLDCGRRARGPYVSDFAGEKETLPAILEGGVAVNLHGAVLNGMPVREGNTANSDTSVFEGLALQADDIPAASDLNESIVDPVSLPGYNLPNNGIFHLNTDPAHPYLIETDPAINTYKGFLGSDYLLDRLEGWAPDITQQRLGDGYYEIMLVREALLASLGTRFIDAAIADEKAQFEYLMNNAIAASEALQLSPGIALSREQIDTLQSDIVWMEQRVVAGHKVLVPVVYLAQGSSRVLRDGSVISGGALSVEGESFQNAGLVRATEDARITTESTLANLDGEIRAGDSLALRSGDDLINESGRISGGNVLLQAEGDIVHRTWAEQDAANAAHTSSWSTRVGDTASVYADNALLQIATGNIQLKGAHLQGGDVALAAGASILLDTVKTRQGYRYDSADWQAAEEYVRHLQTEVEATKELRLLAAADIMAIAASLKAGGDLTLEAGNAVTLLAAEESDHRESHTQHDGSLEDKSHDLVHDEVRTTGSRVDAGGRLAISARQGDITLYASSASAGESASVSAGGNITLLAGVNTAQHREQHSESNAATFSNQDKGYIAQTAVASGIAAGGDLNLQSAGNINLVASVLDSQRTLRIGGSEVDQAALASGNHAALPLNLNVTTLALTNESWNHREEGFSGPLEELVKAASFGAALLLGTYTVGQLDMPEIKLGEHRRTITRDVVQAGSALAAHDMDIRVQEQAAFIGAQLAAPGVIAVAAQNIVIDAAQETRHYRHEEGSDTVQGLGAKLDKDKGEYRLAGVQETKTSLSESRSVVEWKGSTINAGQLILDAKQNIAILDSTLEVVEDALLQAGETLTISGREGSVTAEHQEVVETITVGLAVRNAYHDAVQAIEAVNDATEALENAKAALDEAERKVTSGQLAASDLDYFKVNVAAAAVNLANATIGAAGALATAGATAAATFGTGLYVSGSAQRDKVTTTSTTTQTAWQGSELRIGGNALLSATDTLGIKGSHIGVAGALALQAQDISITAGEERSTQKTSVNEEHEGASVSVTPNNVTVNLNASFRDTDADSSALHYVNSHLDAGMLISRSDALRVAGAQLNAGDVDIETSKLVVASLQDEAQSTSQTRGGSMNLSLGAAGPGLSLTAGGGGIEMSDSSSTSRWVSEQTQIIGSNSIRIRAKDTVLTGATVANAEWDEDGALIDKGGLDFQSGTLTVHELHDYQYSKTTGFNFSTTLNTEAFIPHVSGQATGQTTIGGQYFGHETEQLTRVTLGQGSVVVGGELLAENNVVGLGLSLLNRDVGNTQEITRDQSVGGLNASVTIDNRWLTEDGREAIASDIRNMDNNLAGLGKLATATTVAAATALASQLTEEEAQALAVLGNPAKAAEFVKEHPELAAAIAAYQSGDYEGLLITREGLQGLANALGVSVEVLTTDVTAKLGVAGTTDGRVVALDITKPNRDDLTATLGHEVAHNQGLKNETLASLSGWAADLGFSAGLDFNNEAIDQATLQLGNGRDADTYAKNAELLKRDNSRLIEELADHGEEFENLLSDDQVAAYRKELNACAGLYCRAKVELKWGARSAKQDGALTAGFALGLANGLKGDVQGVATILTDLPGAVRGIGELLNNPDVRKQMGQQIYNDLKSKYDEVNRLLEHGEDATDMVGLGANIGELTYAIVGYATLVKGAATTGTKVIANAGKAGGEALDTLVKNVSPPPALAVVGGGKVGSAMAATGKPAGLLANSGKPLAQVAVGSATLASEASPLNGSGRVARQQDNQSQASNRAEEAVSIDTSTELQANDDFEVSRSLSGEIYLLDALTDSTFPSYFEISLDFSSGVPGFLENVSQSDIIVAVPKGLRPAPIAYMELDSINAHLSLFEGGVTKIKASAPTGIEGPPGGTFVMPTSVADNLIKSANGSVAELERLLSLEPGALGGMPIRVDINNPMGLRMPSGNELGANSQWIPMGFTKGGIPEATIDPVRPGEYTTSPAFKEEN